MEMLFLFSPPPPPPPPPSPPRALAFISIACYYVLRFNYSTKLWELHAIRPCNCHSYDSWDFIRFQRSMYTCTYVYAHTMYTYAAVGRKCSNTYQRKFLRREIFSNILGCCNRTRLSWLYWLTNTRRMYSSAQKCWTNKICTCIFQNWKCIMTTEMFIQLEMYHDGRIIKGACNWTIFLVCIILYHKKSYKSILQLFCLKVSSFHCYQRIILLNFIT